MRPNMRGMETFDTSRPAVAAPAVSPTDTRATDPKAYAQASTIVPIRGIGVRYRSRIARHLLVLGAAGLALALAAWAVMVRRSREMSA